MKKSVYLALLFAWLFVNSSTAASSAAHIRMDHSQYSFEHESNNLSKKEIRKEKRFRKKVDKLKEKLNKKRIKFQKKSMQLDTGNYLLMCLLLLLGSIILFAIGGSLFNIFGSFALLGSVIFFVLWILDFTGNL